MDTWPTTFLALCQDNQQEVALGDGAFAPGPALWVGKREVAHFDDDHTLDLRLTKAVIRQHRDRFRQDARISLRRSGSDWVEIHVGPNDDYAWVTDLVREAIAANVPTASPGPPPTGAELDRRRRFH